MGFVGRKVDDVMGRYGTVSIGGGTEGRGVKQCRRGRMCRG